MPLPRLTVPSIVAPSMKVTDPVGVVVGERTVAVNFTDWPAVAGFFEETTVVVVVAGLTTCEVVPELVADWESPP